MSRKRLLSTRQAAAELRVSERRVRALAAAGRIPGARRLDGNGWIIPARPGCAPVVLPAPSGRGPRGRWG